MKRTPIRSTNITSVGYDPETRQLEVEFKAGKVYVYQNVPAVVYHEMMRAPSPGHYFDVAVKRAHYPYTVKVEQP